MELRLARIRNGEWITAWNPNVVINILIYFLKLYFLFIFIIIYVNILPSDISKNLYKFPLQIYRTLR